MGRRAEAGGLSVVVPLFNEADSVRPLVEAVRASLSTGIRRWELILVDDGSSDSTALLAEELAASDPRVRVLRLARNYGQTGAMQAGFDHARGSVIVSLDGDLQNDPGDIPRLIEKLNEGFDLVAGYRERRQDKLITRKVPSWVANRLIRRITGIPIRDNGCSLKAYRRTLLQRIRLYSDMHRFIPAVAAGMAGARIAEIPVRHHPRRYGVSKYGLSRIMKVLGDLLIVRMIRFWRERPLAMFSSAAAAAATVGVLLLGQALFLSIGPDRPLVVLSGAALLMMGLACYLFMLGLLGEFAVRRHHQRLRPSAAISHEETV